MMAEELNRQGINAPRGGTWHPTGVARLLNRRTVEFGRFQAAIVTNGTDQVR
jgi:hypothetical protein